MFYKPKENPFTLDPFKSLVFPRPIGWISSVDKKGNANLAPYSYFNAIADDPPQIMFASAAPELPSKFKDSLANILETKEFVVNFATSITRKQMNLSSLDASKDQDEFVELLIDRNSPLAVTISTKINIAHQDKFYAKESE